MRKIVIGQKMSYRDASRASYVVDPNASGVTHDQMNSGSLQRIADALERSSDVYTQLAEMRKLVRETQRANRRLAARVARLEGSVGTLGGT